MALALVYTVTSLDLQGFSFAELIQISEAGLTRKVWQKIMLINSA